MHATLGTIETEPVRNGQGAGHDEYAQRAYEAGAWNAKQSPPLREEEPG